MKYLVTIVTLVFISCGERNTVMDTQTVQSIKDSIIIAGKADSTRNADSIVALSINQNTTTVPTPSEFLEFYGKGGPPNDFYSVLNIKLSYTKEFVPILTYTLNNKSDKVIDSYTVSVRMGKIPVDNAKYYASTCVFSDNIEPQIKPNTSHTKSLTLQGLNACGDKGVMWIDRIHFTDGSIQQFPNDWNPAVGYEF